MNKQTGCTSIGQVICILSDTLRSSFLVGGLTTAPFHYNKNYPTGFLDKIWKKAQKKQDLWFFTFACTRKK